MLPKLLLPRVFYITYLIDEDDIDEFLVDDEGTDDDDDDDDVFPPEAEDDNKRNQIMRNLYHSFSVGCGS